MANYLLSLDKNKKYKLVCGHKNIAIPNVWPFDMLICLDCGYKTTRPADLKEIKNK